MMTICSPPTTMPLGKWTRVAFGAEAAAGELVGRGDSVGLVDADADLELSNVEMVGRADAGEDGFALRRWCGGR